jgi:hypothetical protein
MIHAEDARESGVALETTRRALIAAAWPTFAFTQEKMEVYVLANGVEFERYFARRTLSLSFRALLGRSSSTAGRIAGSCEHPRSSTRQPASVAIPDLTNRGITLPRNVRGHWAAFSMSATTADDLAASGNTTPDLPQSTYAYSGFRSFTTK